MQYGQLYVGVLILVILFSPRDLLSLVVDMDGNTGTQIGQTIRNLTCLFVMTRYLADYSLLPLSNVIKVLGMLLYDNCNLT